MTVMKSDVVERVIKALAEDERTAAFDISVVDEQGVVTLAGSAESSAAKDAAGEIAAEQDGVIDVVNDLVVEEPDVGGDLVTPPPDLRGGTVQ